MRAITVILDDETAEKLDALRQYLYEETLVMLGEADYIGLLIRGHFTGTIAMVNEREGGDDANPQHH